MLNQDLDLPNKVQIPHSDEFADFVNRLLEKIANERLGKFGDFEVRNHAWFKECTYIDYLSKNAQGNCVEITLPAIDFEALQNRQLYLPYWCYEKEFDIREEGKYRELQELFDMRPLDRKFEERRIRKVDLGRVQLLQANWDQFIPNSTQR